MEEKNMIQIGDEVVDITSGVYGVVIKQYYPTGCEQQTMIQCDDGRKYHAPTRYFIKKNYISDSEIDRNPYLSETGKYAAKLARNHGISVSEAMTMPMVKAYAEAQNYLTEQEFKKSIAIISNPAEAKLRALNEALAAAVLCTKQVQKDYRGVNVDE